MPIAIICRVIIFFIMALGICSICHQSQAKYKCPKCSVEYCSLACFKNPAHDHLAVAAGSADKGTANSGTLSIGNSPPTSDIQPTSAPDAASVFDSIASDPVIKSLLGYKSLQVHLAVILRILSESTLTNEPLAENRREIANLRLCDLRANGPQENALVEEFVQRVLYLTSQNSEKY